MASLEGWGSAIELRPRGVPRHHNHRVTGPANAAIDEPWVRQELSHFRRKAWLQVGGGLALFVLVGVLANVFAGSSDRLRQSGGRTSGVIAQLRGFSATEDTAALVDYTVDGHAYEQKVDLGNRIRHYRTRQEVTVYYDPDHPSTMTIDDIDNAPTWTTLPMAIGFVAGLVLMVVGVFGLVGNRRHRRQLGAQPWQDGAALVGARGTGLYVTTADGRLLRAWRPPKAPVPDPAARLRVVPADKGVYVALGDVSPELLKARPARNDREEQGWRRLLAGPPPP